jgi:hypothetical protein
MAITIDVDQRNALYDLLRLRISGLSDVSMALEKREYPDAARLGRWYAAELRLLDDLGWAERSERTSFELTMSADELRPLLIRLQETSTQSVEAYITRPKQDEEDALSDLGAAAACGQVLNALSVTETEEER